MTQAPESLSSEPPSPGGDRDPAESEADRLDAVGELMQACLACEDSLRARAIEQACADHPEHAQALQRRFAFLREAGLDDRDAEAAPLPERFGDFQPVERLAAGGMGVVYRARQISLDRPVALKLVRPELLYFDGARERFRREAASIAQLEHPGIVPIYAAGEVDGVPYLAMPLIEGCTLAEALGVVAGRAPESLAGVDLLAAARDRAQSSRESASLPSGFEAGWVKAAATVTRDVALALAHAHSRGIVHRDVKPSNVLLGSDGRARLIDFGLTGSESSDGLTRAGSYLGTLHYMSPERLRGERGVDVRSDIYSAGVMLYELLALQVPFQAESRGELERRVQDGRIDALRGRNRRVNADLESVCLEAMALEPRNRYPDAAALAGDLDRWLAGLPVRAKPPGVAARALGWARRHRALTAALLLGALLLFGVPALLYNLERRHGMELSRSLEAERAALLDMRVANEIITGVLRDASPAHGDGHVVTLVESLEKMARLAASGDNAPRARAGVLSMLGQIHLSRSDYDSAERLLTDAERQLVEHGYGASKERAIALETLGAVHKARGNLEAAREHYRSAATTALDAGLDGREWRSRMGALEAVTYFATDRARAAELLRSALAEYPADSGSADDRDWLKTNRLKLAQLEAGLGRAQEGLALIDAVRAQIALQERPSLRDRLELAAAESELAVAAKDLPRAERVLREGLTEARAGTGERSSPSSSLLFQLGVVLARQGRADEARAAMEQALDIRRELTGEDSPAARQWEATLRRHFPDR
ncbi:MAG: protein kinase [Planctomycetes bacterium]|nr:protein kinase [Planctomycetota bacterium]